MDFFFPMIPESIIENLILGCDGVPNSGKVIDVCGVCGGNGNSCKGIF